MEFTFLEKLLIETYRSIWYKKSWRFPLFFSSSDIFVLAFSLFAIIFL